MNSRLYQTKSVHAQIAHELGRRIASGALAEGELLPKEADFQAEFSASRQAVREALKVLAAKGMIYSRKRAGTFVNNRASWNMLDPDVLAWHPRQAVPKQVLHELIELRVMIEPFAARLAAKRAGPCAIHQIELAVEQMRGGVDDPSKFYDADLNFHLAVFGASGNSLVDRLSTIISPLLEAAFSRQREVHGPFDEGYLQHERVYEAIKSGDHDAAEAAMRALLVQAKEETTSE